MSGPLVRIAASELRRFYVDVFQRLGTEPEDAALVAEVLLDADLRGIETHGLARLPLYVQRIQQGGVLAHTELTTIRDSGSIVVLDAADGLGQVAGSRAMRLAVERAKEHGIAVVTVRRSNHLGALAYYPRLALESNMIGLAITGISATLAPSGGVSALLGTSPWSIAVPARRHPPILIDLSNSTVLPIQIREAVERGTSIPLGWALGPDGAPTQDPRQAQLGTLIPIGGHKGLALSLAFEVLSSVLSGAAYADQISRSDEASEPRRIGQFFLALDVLRFMPIEEFLARVDDLLDRLKGSRLAPDQSEIRIPGERSHRTTQERLATGVPISPELLERIRSIASELGAERPETLPD